MNTKKNDQNQGHGRGLVPLGDALALAVVETDNVKAAEFVGAALGVELGAEQVAQGMEARSIGGAALASCERPAGPLLLEAQGQFDLALADRCARKLAGRMVADGREVNEASIADAIGAGACALTVWRATGRGADGQVESLAARVAWRAVVLAISANTLGDSVALHSVSDDWLFAQALPRESRIERLIRWQVERRALGRSALLVRRVEALKARGGRGRRVQAVERVGHAARLMLAGDDVDTAAARAGFRSSGHATAANQFGRALRRLGLGIVSDARIRGRGVAKPEQVAARV